MSIITTRRGMRSAGLLLIGGAGVFLAAGCHSAERAPGLRGGGGRGRVPYVAERPAFGAPTSRPLFISGYGGHNYDAGPVVAPAFPPRQ